MSTKLTTKTTKDSALWVHCGCQHMRFGSWIFGNLTTQFLMDTTHVGISSSKCSGLGGKSNRALFDDDAILGSIKTI